MSLSFPPGALNGQVYQGWVFDGEKWNPNWASKFVTSIAGKSGALAQADAAGSGNRVLLATVNVSAAVQFVNFNGYFGTTYDEYQIDCECIAPAADALFYMQMSYDGTTWSTTSDNWAAWYTVYVNPATGAPAAGAVQYIGFSSTAHGSTYDNTVWIKLPRPWDTGRPKNMSAISVGANGSNSGFISTAGGGYQGASPAGYPAVTAVRFMYAAGGTINIARGTFKLYGIVL
jgi:hypothetical protein